MWILFLLMFFTSMTTQALMERVYDYWFLGPQLMREVRYLCSRSRDIDDYDRFRQEHIFSMKAPWYIRLMSTFEKSEERKLERLWYDTHKQFNYMPILEKEMETSMVIQTFFQKVQPLKLQTDEMIKAPVPVGSLTKYDMYKKSKEILGDILYELLQVYTNFLSAVNNYFLKYNDELISSELRSVLSQKLGDIIEIKKRYDLLGISSADLWYVTQVDKQFESYMKRLLCTVQPMTAGAKR